MSRVLFVAAGLCSLSALGAVRGLPSVTWRGGALTASPGTDGIVENSTVEILELEECGASVLSKTSLKVTGQCQFLKGLYSFRQRDVATGTGIRTFVGFTFSSAGPGHVLMVSGPLLASDH